MVGKDGEDLTRHNKWLCMMYPRLKLLHKLLANDSAIFISIDDNEQANLKLICDEIFGMRNFVANVIWERSDSPRMDAQYYSTKHEHILNYAKNIDSLEIARLKLSMNNLPKHHNKKIKNGKGFFINGFKANHYPDFILQTKSGKTILLETKGDHLDGTDSAAKCRLGNEWEKQAGHNFAYCMVFDKKEVPGAYILDKAKELIKRM